MRVRCVGVDLCMLAEADDKIRKILDGKQVPNYI